VVEITVVEITVVEITVVEITDALPSSSCPAYATDEGARSWIVCVWARSGPPGSLPTR
jgi:hypothetical protein